MTRTLPEHMVITPLIVALTTMPALANGLNSSGAQGQMGFTSDYTRRGVYANRNVHDYQGNTSTDTPRSLGGLPPTTTAVLGGVFGTPDDETEWGALPDDVAPISTLAGSDYEDKTSITESYNDQQAGNRNFMGSDYNPTPNSLPTSGYTTSINADAYTNFVKNWKGSGPPPVPIFQCAYGWGWMPQAGANATSNPGGGYHGQAGGIVRTGSWNSSSLGSGF